MDIKKLLQSYKQFFSKERLFSLLKTKPKKLGSKLLYTTMLLYYAFRRKETPSWAKNIIIGTLGYLVSPIDLIPDLTPVLGYTDDLGMLSFGLVTIASFINKEVKEKASEKITKWLPNWDTDVIEEVDRVL